MPFTFEPSELAGVTVVKPKVFSDERGELAETYLKEDFEEAGIETEFIQDKYSESRNGVLRGLHFQKGEHAQAKLVRCPRGVVLDVVVDLRRSSPTFGQHETVILSEFNDTILFHPRGLAHGYLVLSDRAAFQYKLDNHYSPENEAGIIWNDPTLDIDWPIADPILSEKDQDLPTLEEASERGILFE